MKLPKGSKAKAAPREGVGVTASMIIVDTEESEGSVVAHAVKAPDNDHCYAMLIQVPMQLLSRCTLI